MSNVILETDASRSKASPSRTRKLCLVAFPIAAMMAVGVAKTRAQGQKTTRMVTARMISPVRSQVKAAALRAITTIQVAHRSAMPTIFAFPASADCTRRIMRWMELSSPTLVAFISKEPNWLTVPLDTGSPGCLSTGRDSPVMTAWLIDVSPETIFPSTGMVSPGRTRSRSPTQTCSAGIISSWPPASLRAVWGVRWTSFSMPARAFATVRSSKRAPSCMINAISPAAKSSPMSTEAIKAMDTSTSALMSKAVTSPMKASKRMGTPQRIIATQAASKGRGSKWKMLMTKEIPERTRQAMSFFSPPHSKNRSNACIEHPSFYTYGGICI